MHELGGLLKEILLVPIQKLDKVRAVYDFLQNFILTSDEKLAATRKYHGGSSTRFENYVNL